MNAQKLSYDVVKELVKLSRNSTPQSFKAFFMGAIVTNTIGNLPESYWQEFIKAEPCDQPNCNCHELAALAAPVLQAMRADFLKHRPANN